MTDYGKGTVLGAATLLPATSATAVMLGNTLHPVVVTGFIVLNVLWFVMLTAHITRYIVNRRAK